MQIVQCSHIPNIKSSGHVNVQTSAIFACPNISILEHCKYINTLELIYSRIVNIRILQHPNIQTPEDTNYPLFINCTFHSSPSFKYCKWTNIQISQLSEYPTIPILGISGYSNIARIRKFWCLGHHAIPIL